MVGDHCIPGGDGRDQHVHRPPDLAEELRLVLLADIGTLRARSDVTWQMDIMHMSTRGTNVKTKYSYALLCVDIGTRRVRGERLPGPAILL